MRIDRDAAPIVGDGEKTRGFQADIDEGSVAGDGLVHRIVEGFREKMMKRRLVGAANIHAGPSADGLQPFQHLDRGGSVGRFHPGFRRLLSRWPSFARASLGVSTAGRAGGSLRAALPKRSPFLAMHPSVLVIRKGRGVAAYAMNKAGMERNENIFRFTDTA